MADYLEKVNLDFKVCIVCQKADKVALVDNPAFASFEKVLTCLEEWASYGDTSYWQAWEKLKLLSPSSLEKEQPSWHRTCYQDVTHSGVLKRAQQRHERQLVGPNESRRKSSVNVNSDERSILTRSRTSPFSKDVCFFCDCKAGYRETLVNVKTFGAGESLRKAISLSHNEKLTVKMNTALAANDAHSIDIKYHTNCWSKNVSNVLRRPSPSCETNSISASEIAAKIGFLTMTEIALHNGKTATMSELHSAFESILEENNVPDASCKRKVLKQLLQKEIPDIEFHKPKCVNESERIAR
ncbi:uncharacterized protein [Montipora capricornis]|uniref:uncharacterized protein n=1 Tax=Montipora capricornis TaxID=246305 RepID=UPI0035F1DE76